MQDSIGQFVDSKLGLFIHFGLYSILGGEFEGRSYPGLAEWIQTGLDIPRQRYRQLMEEFDPKQLDADAICARAASIGCRYLCLTAKHHDGFALWDTSASDFNSVASPCGRDLVAEFAEACRCHGLDYCLYYSQAQDWEDPDGYEAYHDNSRKDVRAYFERKVFPQVEELLTKYGAIRMLWLDTPMETPEYLARRLRDQIKRLQPDCLISGRIGFALGDYRTCSDNQLPALPQDFAWEVPATTNGSWGFKRSDTDWRDGISILRDFIKVISRGGNYLINVGPDGQGQVPEGAWTSLALLEHYTQANAEAIYGSQATAPYVYDDPRILLTQKARHLYLHLMEAPGKSSIALQHIIAIPQTCRLVSKPEHELKFFAGRDLEGFNYWEIDLSSIKPETYPLAIDIEHLSEEIEMEAF
ncbi:MAG: alpha-L-fucosidase [Eubacteriales bacterium]|nr:alpha-L-fucosidase [Eubacteriales bacterium]